jgi:hypothetical protein
LETENPEKKEEEAEVSALTNVYNPRKIEIFLHKLVE